MRSRGRGVVLLDTNVLVYAHDPRNKAKQELAIQVLDHLATRRMAVLSSQVLGEFFVVATRKLPDPLPTEEAAAQVERFLRYFPVLEVTGTVVLEACRGVRQHRLAYWDAQIWATARLNAVPLVLSEDFSDGLFLEGVTFRNPFLPSFDLSSAAGEG
ncbi:tRNA(fMet)-specific endonuclease VapC [bacterium HR24]|nr:tRNA(fMet)-specific endonuclease VapC [bacterium HR24]